VKAITFAGWCLTVVGGVVSVFLPPMTTGVPFGTELTAVWAVLWVVGGAVAAGAVFPGWWKAERLGIAFIGVGLAVYFSVIVVLHFGGTGSRVSQMTMLTLAAVGLLRRWHEIRGHDYEPRG